MRRRLEIQNLLNVKTGLAEKYERRAKRGPSKPRKKRLFNRAKTYRQQVGDLAIELQRRDGAL